MTDVSTETAVTDVDDAAVLARSQHEPTAFAAIFDRHAAEVYRFLARRVGEQLADDLTEETMLRAFEQRHRFDHSYRNCLPWLYGIATNLIRKHRRSQARQYRALARLDVDPATDGHADTVSRRVSASAVARTLGPAIARLSRTERDILLLIAWERLTYDEVAIALDIPIGTVRSKLHRVRHKLAGALGGANPLDLLEEGT